MNSNTAGITDIVRPITRLLPSHILVLLGDAPMKDVRHAPWLPPGDGLSHPVMRPVRVH